MSEKSPFAVRGLYAITPEESDTQVLLRKVGLALTGGVKMVQYRNKLAPPKLRSEHARELLAICRSAGVPLIINDDLELALESGADGVHLGREDGDLRRAREQLGPDRLLGASCYDSLALAHTAVALGADHVAFGSVFGSPTKPGAVKAPLALFERARREFAVPLVAIGGITPQNAMSVIDAGAHALAVISALFDAPDIKAAAGRFNRIFENR
jgi:thiamine-phosphate pyrophosphorylase